jgi:hypothetical protein
MVLLPLREFSCDFDWISFRTGWFAAPEADQRRRQCRPAKKAGVEFTHLVDVEDAQDRRDRGAWPRAMSLDF